MTNARSNGAGYHGARNDGARRGGATRGDARRNDFRRSNTDLVVGGACALGFVVLAAMVFSGATAGFDAAGLSLAAAMRTPWLTAVMTFITNVCSPLGFFAIVAVVALLFARDTMMLQLMSLGGAGVLNALLKVAFCRPRPEGIALMAESGYSFPSGHAMMSMAALGMMWVVLERRVDPRYRRALTVTCAALVFLVCASRVYLGVHYPSDVLGGVLASAAWVAFVHHFSPDWLNAVGSYSRRLAWGAKH